MIKKISVINKEYSVVYEVGQKLDHRVIGEIKLSQIYYTGDPYDLYCGYSESGEMLFSINTNAPTVVEYL